MSEKKKKKIQVWTSPWQSCHSRSFLNVFPWDLDKSVFLPASQKSNLFECWLMGALVVGISAVAPNSELSPASAVCGRVVWKPLPALPFVLFCVCHQTYLLTLPVISLPLAPLQVLSPFLNTFCSFHNLLGFFLGYLLPSRCLPNLPVLCSHITLLSQYWASFGKCNAV